MDSRELRAWSLIVPALAALLVLLGIVNFLGMRELQKDMRDALSYRRYKVAWIDSALADQDSQMVEVRRRLAEIEEEWR